MGVPRMRMITLIASLYFSFRVLKLEADIHIIQCLEQNLYALRVITQDEGIPSPHLLGEDLLGQVELVLLQ
jgi:hypothetical protein